MFLQEDAARCHLSANCRKEKEDCEMEFEFRILDFIQGMRTPFGDAAMPFVSSLGNAGMIWVLLAVILLVLPTTRKTGAVLAAALCFDAVLCNGILKNLFARIRPCSINTSIQLLIEHPREYSFPSGHTAASFAAASALYFSGRRKFWIPALVLACVIAFSRMYLYVHFPTDILGGILVGIFSGYAGYKMINILWRRRI